jgi:large subunit ribosomal protein L17
MRHRSATTKLGRKSGHLRSLLANQVCSLILHERIRTTLSKAKAVRPIAEKMVTLGKSGTLHDRRNATAFLGQPGAVRKLFAEIAPRCAERVGGYTRIIKLGQRFSDAAPMAFIEWVDAPAVTVEPDTEETKEAPTKKAKKGKVVEAEVIKEEPEKKPKKAEKKPAAKKKSAE